MTTRTHTDQYENPDLDVHIHTSWQTLEPLSELWDALLEQNATQAYFLRYAWNQRWWQTFAPAHSRLFVMVCRDAKGEVLGIAPFYCQVQRCFKFFDWACELNFIGTGIELLTSEHMDVLARRGHEASVAQAIVKYLNTHRNWDRLRLLNLSADSAVLVHLQHHLKTQPVTCDQAPFIGTQTSWEALRQTWSSKFRYNIERGQRRLAEAARAEFACVTTPEQLLSASDDFVRLHQMRWTSQGKVGAFADQKFEVFLRAEMRHALEAKRLRFWTYSLDGRCVAALIAFVENGVAHYFQSGFDVDYQKHSLGSVMVYQCLQDCVADPSIREFDFMGGSSAYKGSWTSQTRAGLVFDAWRPGFKAWVCGLGRKVWCALRLTKRVVQKKYEQLCACRLRYQKWLAVGLGSFALLVLSAECLG